MKNKYHLLNPLLIILICLIIPNTATFAEAPGFKELQKRLEKSPNKEKIKIYLKLSLSCQAKNGEKCLNYAQKALALARQINDKSGEADALRQIAFGYYYSVKGENEKALKLLNQTLQIYRVEDDKKGMAFALNNIGIVYYKMDKVKRSLDYQLKSLKLKEQMGDKKGIISSLNNIGLIYWHTGKYSDALKCFSRAAKNLEEIGNPKSLCRVLLNMGLVYWNWGEYDLALENYYKALEIMERIQDQRAIAVCTNNIGLVYRKTGRFDEALTFHLRALRVSRESAYKYGESNALNSIGVVYQEKNQLEKSIDYFLQSLELKEKMGNKKGIANTLLNLGNIALKQGELKPALDYCLRSLKHHQKIGNKIGVVNCLNTLGSINTKLRQYDRSFIYAKKALKLAEELQVKEPLKNCYALFSKIYETSDQYKNALKYYKLFNETKDKIFTDESDEKISRLQTRYKTLEKDKEIKLLQKNSKIQQLEVSYQKTIRNVAIIFTVLVLIIFMQFFRQYRYLFSFWKKKNYIAHYRILDKIGSGGMGEIYKARDMRTKTGPYAVKVLRDEYYRDDNYKRRFKNEAALVDQLNHPNIVKVIERGEFEGNLYIAMELLEGQTLYNWLQKNNKPPMVTIISIMMQTTDALIEIHKRGIIHRDLKPENIMVTETGELDIQIKILDFGLARTRNLSRLTQSGMVMGTLYYASPEQLTRSEVLQESDIYSLGVIFYQVVTGVIPFVGDTAFEIARKIQKEEPPEILTINPDVPPEIAGLLRQMMAKDPDLRPSAQDIIESLKK